MYLIIMRLAIVLYFFRAIFFFLIIFLFCLLLSLLLTLFWRIITIIIIYYYKDSIEVISFIAVIYNIGLIFFTGDYTNNISSDQNWIYFILVEHFVFITMFVIRLGFDKVPPEVKMQLQRYKNINNYYSNNNKRK